MLVCRQASETIVRNILVTGALGQIGSELVPALRAHYGAERVIATDIRMLQPGNGGSAGPYEHVDCTRPHQIHEVMRRHDIGTIYHMAALLSAVAEDKPQIAWSVNMGGLYNVLEVARQYECAVFFPSSIGAFGPSTPRDHTPQVTVQRPTTMYGVTKVSGELLADYYAQRFGVDTRGLRLPGLISYSAPPGGGTTDYAVEIFHQAIRYRHYTCFLSADTRLDMMYMPDAIRAMIELMQADAARLNHRNAYNVTAMTITPAELAAAIERQIPGFVIDYEVDPVRQAIAESWPRSLDDSAARTDWGWTPRYDLDAMCADMIEKLGARLKPASRA
ncbi:L-threonine 3-dehydrogenase [Microbaculum marinisediminis]|uniref:L-threonine 3-dehydrogenase n=1 Tax=Microbaculum marinisediminis TaxID=2931392 RepID=A0AAW5R094_9HYPH|nr:L-threonine 3-dehydrogenase [Microbaculum sp. A6E488]MCT8973695.1 L-threonine 3-dehydrogenase [Microbaculum sp. A6E488]